MNMDYLTISGLQTTATIGVYDWERRQKQVLLIDLILGFQNQAGSTDDLKDALNYDAICTHIRNFVMQSEHRLIEALAETTCTFLLETFDMQTIKLTIHKNAVATAKGIALTIERAR